MRYPRLWFKIQSLFILVLYLIITIGSLSIYLLHDMAHMLTHSEHSHADHNHSHTHSDTDGVQNRHHVYVSLMAVPGEQGYMNTVSTSHRHHRMLEILLSTIEPEEKNLEVHTWYVGLLYFHMPVAPPDEHLSWPDLRGYADYGISQISSFIPVPPTPPPRNIIKTV